MATRRSSASTRWAIWWPNRRSISARCKANIRAALEEHSQASIGDVLSHFPAAQGLGSVVGYMALGVRHGLRGERSERVEWLGSDEQWRSARIPTIYFLRERIHELA